MKKSAGLAVETKPARADGRRKARRVPAPPGNAAWLGWVILGTMVAVAAGLAIAAARLGRG